MKKNYNQCILPVITYEAEAGNLTKKNEYVGNYMEKLQNNKERGKIEKSKRLDSGKDTKFC